MDVSNTTLEQSTQGFTKYFLKPCEFVTFTECRIAVLLWKALAPILIILGTVGNVMTLLIMARRKLNTTSYSVYLRFLAISDLVVLYIGPLRELLWYAISFDIREVSNLSCRLHVWLATTFCAYSGWLLAAVAVDRLLMIKTPTMAKAYCTRFKATLVSLLCFFFVAVINFHLLFGLVLVEVSVVSNDTNAILVYDKRCMPSSEVYRVFFYNVWPVVIFIAFSVLPVGCIVISSSCIASIMWKRNNTFLSQSRNQRSFNKMLLLVSAVFVVASLPICIYLIVEPLALDYTDPHDIARRMLWYSSASILMFSNSATNFPLYCLGSTLFRRECADFVTSICRRSRINRIIPVNEEHGNVGNRNSRLTDQPVKSITKLVSSRNQSGIRQLDTPK